MRKDFYKLDKAYILTLLIKLLAIVGLIVLDLALKTHFQKTITENHSKTFINGVISFSYVKNSGAAFSLFSNSTVILTIISVVFLTLVFLYDWFNHSTNYWYISSFVLITAGAFGNLIDRLFFGYVRDFIKLDFISFPIFNIADMLLTIGIICYGVYIFFYYNKEQEVGKLVKDSSKKVGYIESEKFILPSAISNSTETQDNKENIKKDSNAIVKNSNTKNSNAKKDSNAFAKKSNAKKETKQKK